MGDCSAWLISESSFKSYKIWYEVIQKKYSDLVKFLSFGANILVVKIGVA